MEPFVPVLLGSDVNVYGMARSFHEAYGIASVAIGKGRLGATSNSRIVSVEVVEPRLEEDDVFCKTLLDFADRYPEDMPLLLVPCGDNYMRLLVRNQEALRERYRFTCVDQTLLTQLETKESFYGLCEKYGFSYGALYRWKRRGLIPEEWFIRKSTSTGQETFFNRAQICERIEQILRAKDETSLERLQQELTDTPIRTLILRTQYGDKEYSEEAIRAVCIKDGKGTIYDITEAFRSMLNSLPTGKGETNE